MTSIFLGLQKYMWSFTLSENKWERREGRAAPNRSVKGGLMKVIAGDSEVGGAGVKDCKRLYDTL